MLSVGRLLLLKGDALCSTKNPALAMSPLLEALTLARRSHSMLLAALASIHLASVQASQHQRSHVALSRKLACRMESMDHIRLFSN